MSWHTGPRAPQSTRCTQCALQAWRQLPQSPSRPGSSNYTKYTRVGDSVCIDVVARNDDSDNSSESSPARSAQ
eukprot:1349397-Amphidinium_carterae.1